MYHQLDATQMLFRERRLALLEEAESTRLANLEDRTPTDDEEEV